MIILSYKLSSFLCKYQLESIIQNILVKIFHTFKYILISIPKLSINLYISRKPSLRKINHSVSEWLDLYRYLDTENHMLNIMGPNKAFSHIGFSWVKQKAFCLCYNQWNTLLVLTIKNKFMQLTFLFQLQKHTLKCMT